MILPNYNVKILESTKGWIKLEIEFDKVIVYMYGDSKNKRLHINYSIKNGVRRRNVDLLKYFKAINNYLISNSHFLIDKDNKPINIFDSNNVKDISLRGLKIAANDIEFIKERYNNLHVLETYNCTIYKQANIGILNCKLYHDYKSDIMSLSSLDGFSGRSIKLSDSNIRSGIKEILHLYSTNLYLINLKIDYEKFLLMLDAPNLRNLEINSRNRLTDKHLLFISGLYNLERLEVNAILSNSNQLEKLEKLREVFGILIVNDNNVINQYRINEYLDFLYKLYVDKSDRVMWESKIHSDDIKRIKEELIKISNMTYKDRKNISKEVKEHSLEDRLDGLYFGKINENEEDVRLVNSRPFSGDGIDYYVKTKKIILDE